MERESTPDVTLKLPAEQMARASTYQHPDVARASHSAAFNPFSTPVSDVNFGQSSTGSQHPFSHGGGQVESSAPRFGGGSGGQVGGAAGPGVYPLTIPGSTAGVTSSQQHPFGLGAPSSRTVASGAGPNDATSQGTLTSSSSSSQLLMPGVTPSLPMFSVPATGTDAPPSQGGVGGLNPCHADHRRSSSQSTSAILKDVLQQ